MADRKKERKGARKAAASQRKAVARKKPAAVKTATPRNQRSVQKRSAADGSGTRVVTSQEVAVEWQSETSNFEVFIRLGTATVRVVNEQAQSERPSPVVVTQNAHAMEAVALGATGFLTKLSDGIVMGL